MKGAGGAVSHKAWISWSNATISHSNSACELQRHLSLRTMRMKRRGRWTGSPYLWGLTREAKDQKYMSPAASDKCAVRMSKHVLDWCVLLLKPMTCSPMVASCFPLFTSPRKA